MILNELKDLIEKGGKELTGLLTVLALLIEKKTVSEPGEDYLASINELVGERYKDKNLTKKEFKEAVDFLIRYIEKPGEPPATAVWALYKSNEERTVPVFIEIINTYVSKLESEDLVFQALCGLLNIGVYSQKYESDSNQAITLAANKGYGEVKETANDYINQKDAEYKIIHLINVLYKDILCNHETAEKAASIIKEIDKIDLRGYDLKELYHKMEKCLNSYYRTQIQNNKSKKLDDCIFEYVSQTEEPNLLAIWALNMFDEEKPVLPVFIDITNKYASDPDKEPIVVEVLMKLALEGVASKYKNESIKAIKNAAQNGTGIIKEDALDYIESLER